MNYHNFYNAWKKFAKPKKDLLLEDEGVIENIINMDKMDPADFLKLTTDPETLKSLMDFPSINTPYKASMAKTLSLAVRMEDGGIAKVIRHEGRNRSVAALKANQPVKVDIYVIGQYAKINDISAFKGQMTDVVIETDEIIKNASKLQSSQQQDATDPLDIGQSRDFRGYNAPPLSRDSNEKIQNYLQHSFMNDSKMKDLGIRGYIKLLNDTYTATDGDIDYTFDLTSNFYIDKDTGKKKPPTGMKFVNLVPNPIEVHGGEQAANSKIYTIKKK